MLIGVIIAILIVAVVTIARSGWRPHLPSLPGGNTNLDWVTNSWTVALIGIILIHVTLLVSWPEGYGMLASLNTFWLGHAIIIFLALTSTLRTMGVVWVRRTAMAVLAMCILVEGGVSAHGKWENTQEKARKEAKQETPQDLDLSHLDTIFMKVAREGKPAWVIIPQGWHIEWQEDETKFSSQAIWQGGNKVRVFITRPGVKSVEIPIRRWYEPAKRRR